jgi:uncharacterized SAM-binding protein YcdF (DUF218 family)
MRFIALLHHISHLLRAVLRSLAGVFTGGLKLLRRLRPRVTWRRLAIFAAITVLCWGIVSAGLALTAHSYGQQNEAERADVLIVLGSGLRRDGSPGDALWRRSIWAAETWAKGLAPVILCTGGQSEGQRRSEAAACKAVLIENGVPASAIYLEEQSRSTEENAIHSKAIMAQNGWQNALLVTDAFHMLRAHWIFDSYDIAHYANPVPANRVRRGWYTWLLGREVVAMQWQAFKTVLNLPITSVPIA